MIGRRCLNFFSFFCLKVFTTSLKQGSRILKQSGDLSYSRSLFCVKVFTVDLLESHEAYVDFVRTLFITWPIVRQKAKCQCLPITRHVKMAAIANMRRLHLTTGDCINKRLHQQEIASSNKFSRQKLNMADHRST